MHSPPRGYSCRTRPETWKARKGGAPRVVTETLELDDLQTPTLTTIVATAARSRSSCLLGAKIKRPRQSLETAKAERGRLAGRARLPAAHQRPQGRAAGAGDDQAGVESAPRSTPEAARTLAAVACSASSGTCRVARVSVNLAPRGKVDRRCV
jgi:hypothetical protein